MASGGRKKKDSDGASVWGILGGLAGGLALGGLAVYGASKLIDALGGEEKSDQAAGVEKGTDVCKAKKFEEDDEEEDSSRRTRQRPGSSYSSPENPSIRSYHGDATSLPIGTYNQNPNIRSGPESHDPRITPVREETESAVEGDVKPCNLSELLTDYLETYVNIPEGKQQEALRIVSELEPQLMSVLETTNLPFGPFIHTGSACEGLQVVHPDFDLHLPLRLDPDNWELVDCAESSLHTAGYYLVKRTGWETCQFGSSPWDRYLEGNYLSSQKLCKHLHGVLQFGLDSVDNVEDCYLNNHILRVFVKSFDRSARPISVNVIPLINIGEMSVVSRAHPLVMTHNMEGLKNIWQQNFADQEAEVLKSFDEAGGCQKDCLKILKAIVLNDESFLSHVPPYALKTLVFHLSFQEDVWEREALAERVIDMVMTLRDFLDQGRLPHYFKPSVDLLESETDTFKRRLLTYIQAICATNKISSLLKRQI